MKTHLIYNKISLLILLSFLPFNNEFAYSISKPNKKNISLLITDNKRNYDLTYQQVEFDNKNIENSIQIDINRDIKKQKIDGFGAAITGSSAFNLMQMSPQNRRKFLTETFSIDKGYGFSYLRVPIGCSDFSLSEYTCCDKPGIENFSLQAEEIDYIIPVLKEIVNINPQIKIIGSPWTPPRWMKVNDLKELKEHNSWTAGHLNPEYYRDYGKYFAKWIKSFKDNGIRIYAVTPQNEPLNGFNSASLLMGWEEQMNFINQGLGPVFKEENLNVKIYAFDHNYNYDNIEEQIDYPIKIYKNQEAYNYLSGAAYHNYYGNKEELNRVHDLYPEKELIFSEASIGGWNNGRNLEQRLIEDTNELGLGTVNNWCSASVLWNIMLDNESGPKREKGCQTCYGAVDIDKDDYSTISRNSHYYLLAHMSFAAKPDSYRIESSSSDTKGITFCAFENKDKSLSLVISNDNDKTESITVNDGKKSFNYTLPAKSVCSFSWR